MTPLQALTAWLAIPLAVLAFYDSRPHKPLRYPVMARALTLILGPLTGLIVLAAIAAHLRRRS